MSKNRSFPLVAGLLAAVFLLCACGYGYDSGPYTGSKASYFDGIILAEYNQVNESFENDDFTISFYESGTYHISFSQTPDKDGRCADAMPKNFDAVINKAPRARVISQYCLPDFLRLTIEHNGVTELHDFR